MATHLVPHLVPRGSGRHAGRRHDRRRRRRFDGRHCWDRRRHRCRASHRSMRNRRCRRCVCGFNGVGCWRLHCRRRNSTRSLSLVHRITRLGNRIVGVSRRAGLGGDSEVFALAVKDVENKGGNHNPFKFESCDTHL